MNCKCEYDINKMCEETEERQSKFVSCDECSFIT